MSAMAHKLLECINKEYHNRIDKNFSGDPSVFEDKLFVEKYGYNGKTLENLLDELSKNNFIERWVIGAFTLIID